MIHAPGFRIRTKLTWGRRLSIGKIFMIVKIQCLCVWRNIIGNGFLLVRSCF